MNLKNNYLVIAVVILAIIILACIFISSGSAYMDKNYINVTDDGVIMFDATGYEVNQMDVIEEVYTGQFDNKTFYGLIDNFGREMTLVIHYSSMNDSDSKELEYLNSDFYQDKPIWVGNHSGYYYSVSVEDTNDNEYFDSSWVKDRIIINQ